MGPFLFVWAAPVVVIYAVLLGIYKATGLLDRTSLAIHPLVKRIGVSGRDVTRIVMDLVVMYLPLLVVDHVQVALEVQLFLQ